MQQGTAILGAVLVVIGLVWIGQGLGLLPGSFMSGDSFWAAVGTLVVAAGLGILAWRSRRGRTRPP